MSKDVVKPYSDYGTLDELPGLADSLYDTLQTIKQLEEVRDDLKLQIKAKLGDAKTDAVLVPGTEIDSTGQQVGVLRKVMLAAGRVTRQIDVKKLQANGVTSKVIEASYTTNTGEPSLRLYTVNE